MKSKHTIIQIVKQSKAKQKDAL